MAQKIAPIALRLDTNKHFDASWFGDRVVWFFTSSNFTVKIF